MITSKSTCTYVLTMQLLDPSARACTDLKMHSSQLYAELARFNAKAKCGMIDSMNVQANFLEITYLCKKKLKKPGAALHGLSQGLIDNYGVFSAMLSKTTPARLLESVCVVNAQEEKADAGRD